MFDAFSILSGGLYFSHQPGEWGDWLLNSGQFQPGTAVVLRLANHSSRTMKAVFDEFVSGEDFGFTKTVVPVRLAQHEGNFSLIPGSDH
jgi:FtsP/CotA-like multicopper oxidase with cupredoxin domain